MDSDPHRTFGDLLREHRLARGLTQEQVAERAGLSREAISLLERGGRRAPHRATIALLAKTLKLSEAERARLLATAPKQREQVAATTSVLQGPSLTLPTPLSSFIGREQEIIRVQELLLANRLVTLSGPGGIGKTRLALAVALSLLPRFADGAWLVELAALAEGELVPHATAAAIGVREVPGQPLLMTVAAALQAKHAVLVLDNCEHVIDASARLAGFLLGSCPDLRVLATSREALGIGGEVVWRVPSLAGPTRNQPLIPEHVLASDAARLFVERAQAADSGFALTSQNAPVVAQICWRLDGIPLALELAAARVRALMVERVAARLDDQFRLLTAGSRTALPRQQTLRATIDWSHDLLTDAERLLFRRLAVFAGGCTLEAVEAIGVGDGIASEDVLDLLSQLVGKSLLELDREGDAEWYRLLETVRQYAYDRLVASGEAVAIRDRHRDWYAAFTEEATRGILGREQGVWLRRLDREYANVRAALGWAIERAAVTVALRLGPALTNYWQARGQYDEGREWLDRMLALPLGPPSETPNEVSVARARALVNAGILHSTLGEFVSARALYEESLQLARAIGDWADAALALTRLAQASARHGDQQSVLAQFEDAVLLRRELGDSWELALTLQEYGGTTLFVFNDAARASPLLAESIECFLRAGDRWSASWPLGMLGWADVQLRAPERARAELAESLAIAREVGDLTFLPVLLEYFAGLATAEDKPARAQRLVGAAKMLRTRFGVPPWHWSSSPAIFPLLESSRRTLGNEAQVVEDEGSAMTLEQAVAYALEEDES
jgi:predicted ATPase/DNA-binding XRE family transcriptional regulator